MAFDFQRIGLINKEEHITNHMAISTNEYIEHRYDYGDNECTQQHSVLGVNIHLKSVRLDDSSKTSLTLVHGTCLGCRLRVFVRTYMKRMVSRKQNVKYSLCYR